jgi:cyclopropane fatty-acyl-phospholipid synthase-like methyltransferase
MDESNDIWSERDKHYGIVDQPAMLRAELQATGADYGANSYTTKAQADRLARSLGLGPGKLFLDIGSGAGWPGIYLADSTDATVVLTDIPLEGLRAASRRLGHDDVDGHAVGASGGALPFRDATFDAVTSSDVFC